MAYLTICGVTVTVAVDGVSLSYADVGGEQARAPSGDLVGSPLVSKREWKMTTTPIIVSEFDAWVGLIEGRGHAWTFDADLYSTRGRGPSSGTATIVTSGARWGTGLARIAAGATVTWATALGSSWTTMHWRYETSAWKHYVCRSDGARWVNGVRNDASAGGLSVSSGSASLTGATSLTDFDGLVVMPFAVPDTWPPLLYAQHNAAAWSPLPRVLAAGSLSPASFTARGKVTDSQVLRFARSGALTSGHKLTFSLKEV